MAWFSVLQKFEKTLSRMDNVGLTADNLSRAGSKGSPVLRVHKAL